VFIVVEANPMPVTASLRPRPLFVAATSGEETGWVDTSTGVAGGQGADVVVVQSFESFDTFVVTHGTALIRCAFLIVGDAGAAQDVVQNALERVARRWPAVVEKGYPLAYVRAAVVRTAISSRRRKWHGEQPTGALPDRADADALHAVDNRDRLRRGLETLPPRQRAAVVLRHYLDLDERAAAVALGCSIGTIKSQTAKGLERLRATLDSWPLP
jgi:RNA polymerase sigma-70 factor (sigma-E family)